MPPACPKNADTVSVKVTESRARGVGDEVRTEVVESALTTWATTLEVEPP